MKIKYSSLKNNYNKEKTIHMDGVTIGRSNLNSLIFDHQSISKYHCRIIFEED